MVIFVFATVSPCQDTIRAANLESCQPKIIPKNDDEPGTQKQIVI